MRLKNLFFPVFFLLFSLRYYSREAIAATISVSGEVPASIQINQDFSPTGEINGALAGEIYFTKCRIGPVDSSSSGLTEGQTYNSGTGNWFFDTDAWVEMPQIAITSSSSVFSIKCRVKSGASGGQKVLYLRACLKEADGSCKDSFQSSSGTAFLATEIPTPSPTPLPTATPVPTSTPTPTNTPVPASYSNIYVSEFMAYPESGNEWVELYNNNSFEVNLYGWFIDDLADGGSQPKSISGTISANSYKQFFISDSYFNNTGDDVRLLDGSQNEKDKKSFSFSTKGRSWSKDRLTQWCEQEPSPNSANPDCPSLAPTSTSIPTLTRTPTPTQSLTITPIPTGEQYEFELQNLEDSAQVLGTQLSPSEPPVFSSQDRFKVTSGLFILAGLILLGFSVFFVLKEKFIRQENSY